MATAITELRQRAVRGDFAAHVLSVLPGAFLAVLADRGVIPESVALVLFAASFVGLNLMHMAATWSRSYLDGETWRRAPIAHVAVPVGLAIFALTFEALGGALVLFGAQYYLSLHHAAMQNYGIARHSQRRGGRIMSAATPRLDQAACLLPVMAALAYRARASSTTYDTASLWRPPAWLVVGLGAAGAVAVAAWIVRELRAVRGGASIDALEPGLVLGVTALWVALLLGVKNPLFPFYAIASGHYVQYLFFVRRFEQRPTALSSLPRDLRQAVGPGQRPVRYYLFLLALGGSVVVVLTLVSIALRAAASRLGWRPEHALAIPPYAAAMLGVNLHHYWLDGRVWRRPNSAPAR